MISKLTEFVEAVDAIYNFPGITEAVKDEEGFKTLSGTSNEFNTFYLNSNEPEDKVKEIEELLQEVELSSEFFTLHEGSMINKVAQKQLKDLGILISIIDNEHFSGFAIVKDDIHILI